MATPELAPIGFERFVADVALLGDAIAAGGWRPDYLVGIGRGGIAPALWLSHAGGWPMLSIDLSARQPAFADALVAHIAGRARGREHFLFVDDINDSGATIAGLRAALGAAAAANIRFAVLIDNLVSSERVDYAAGTIDRSVDRRWFVFPWEAIADQHAITREAEESGRLS